jgi:signal transduction histidine kinase/CheY-like chemotaxis protein/PAS domain-containing protein
MLTTMHSLLRRQLIRCFGRTENVPETVSDFVAVVNDAYCQFDDDRAMLERSLEMSSQELLQANSDMRAIFQVLPDLFFRIDSEGTILDYKAGSQTEFYTDPKSLLGKQIQAIPISEVGAVLDRAVQSIKHAESQVSVEYTLPGGKGQVHYEARFLPLSANETIVIIRDITRNKEAESELRTREELLRATLESTADGILVVNQDGIITHSNARFADMWRVPRELIETCNDELVLRTVVDQVKNPEEFLARIRHLYVRTDVAFDTLYFKDGRVFERLSCPLVRGGAMVGRVWSFRDATERNMAEVRVASLNRLKEKLLGPGELGDKLRHIAETVVDVLHADFARIWVTNPGDLCDCGCVHAAAQNDAHRCPDKSRCLHLMASSGRYTHLDGRNHRRVPVGCYKIGRIAAGADAGFLTNDVANDDRVHDHAWASKLGLVSFAGHKVVSADGQVIGVLAFFSTHVISAEDYAFAEVLTNTVSQVIQAAMAETQRLDLQSKLVRAERMESLGILAGGVAHDLNNMLGPMVGYPELILMKLPPESPVRKQVERMGNAARDAAEVIQDLLTLARRGRYEMDYTNLNDVVRGYLDSPGFARLCERHPGVAIDTRLCPSLSTISGSPAHLSKVVMNLVTNALEAMPHGGTLTVESVTETLTRLHGGYARIAPGDYVVLKMRDTGVGIASGDLARIFEPYYSKKRMGISGSGLGLSVVYGVVKDHNGYYDILSEVGRGTEFILYFPVAEAPSLPVKAAAGVEGGTERILVIDDSVEQRELAVDILSPLGYTVVTAAAGAAGVSFLQKNGVDLVLLDMIMEPGFDGLDTYREIIKVHPGQKAIIVSGFAATDRVEQARLLGVGNFVRKPYTRDIIAAAVRRELNRVPTFSPSAGTASSAS